MGMRYNHFKKLQQHSRETSKKQEQMSMYMVNNIGSIPEELANSIRQEVEKSSELLQNIPKKAGMQIQFKYTRFNVLTSKLPGSTLQQLKEKKDKLTHLSGLLSHCLIASMVPQKQRQSQQRQQNHQRNGPLLPTIIEPEFIPTMQDPNFPDVDISFEKQLKIVLKLQAEIPIKETFVRHSINLKEECPCIFPDDSDSCEVFKFQRQYYHKLSKDIEQINSISRDHACITVKRVEKPVAPRKPSHDNQLKDGDNFIKPHSKQPPSADSGDISERKSPVGEEIFQTCQEFDTSILGHIKWNENSKHQKEVEKHYDYFFYLQNLGQMGTFIYKTPPMDFSTPAKNVTDLSIVGKKKGVAIWTRLQNKEIVEIHEGDRIALLMEKPQYKSPLISYEIAIKYPLNH